MRFCLSFPTEIRVFARQTALAACILSFVLVTPAAQTPPHRKLFTNPEDHITFTYPAIWLLNADDDAATAKLRLADLAPPHAVVQLEGNFTGQAPYKDTDFDAGALAYTVVPSETQAACFALPEQLAGRSAQQPPNPTSTPATLDHHPARQAHFSASVAGTLDIHHVIAVSLENRCLIFETVLIRRDADAIHRPLTPAHWHQLQNAFDTALFSVRIGK